MRLMWLCNVAPGVIQERRGKLSRGGMWMDHVLSDLRQRQITIRVLCPGGEEQGQLDEQCSYACFQEGLPYVYLPELETKFRAELETFRPDVIHIWGTEFGHTLAMVQAAQQAGLLEHTVVSIQGLCSVIARHYAEGVPYAICHRSTFRDILRQDNIAQQQKKFFKRGQLEIAALQKVRHVIGRTDWDRACVLLINPALQYHFCNETLRETFYEDQWQYSDCKKYSIFASSCVYPIKGFHYLLEAFHEVVKKYPDATLSVPGKSFLTGSGIKNRLRQNSYHQYLSDLAKQYQLEDKIHFLGSLSGQQMKEAYLEANVFVLPSTIENSPNSLGEAMLLGVPCVAADVGGVTNLMEHGKEGRIYQSTAPYMLAHHILELFAMEDRAADLGNAARAHALRTHDPEVNLETLLGIYEDLA